MLSVTFLNQATPDLDRDGIEFTVMADATSIACFVSRDALCDHFGAAGVDAASLIAAFHAKQSRIRSVARGKIADDALEPDGSVLLKAVDFWI